MLTYYERQQELAEMLKEKLNGLLENDSDIEVNTMDELEEEFENYVHSLYNPYRNLPEIKPCDINQSTSADGWKYAKRK